MGRCLSRITLSLFGGLFLVAGLYTLYIVFIDTPDEVVNTLGLGSAASPAAVSADIDAEVAEQQDEQVSEFGGEIDAANIIEGNTILDSEISVAVETDGFSVDSTGSSGGVSGNGSNTEDISGQGGSVIAYEQRLVELEWPEEFRTGEPGNMRLAFKPLSAGVGDAEISTNTVTAEPIILEDCYDSYEAFVTARIITPDAFEVETLDEATKTMSRGQEVEWRWSLTPESEGTFAITLGLQIEWRLREGATRFPGVCSSLADGTPNTIWGQAVQTEVKLVFGLITIEQASLAGTVLAVLGAASQIPLLMQIFVIVFERGVERSAGNSRNKRRRRQTRRRR